MKDQGNICLPRICLRSGGLETTESIIRYIFVGSYHSADEDENTSSQDVEMADAYSLRQGEEPSGTIFRHVISSLAGVHALELDAAVPTTLLISSMRFLNPFHLAPPTRRKGEWSSVASVGASSFKKGLDIAE